MDIMYLFSNKFPLFCGVFGQQPPLGVFYIRSSLSLGEPEEDEGKTKEPEVSTREQAEFELVHTWMKEGGAPALADDKAQGLLVQVFGLSRPLPLLFCSSILFFLSWLLTIF